MKPVRVLVVDDSAFSRRSITRMLEGLPGVDVVGYAIDGEEGIRQVINLKPDLVTLDLEMPRMDGFTLLRILTGRFSLPVIVVSARSDADKVFRALELGAVDFVPKPSSDANTDLLSITEDLQQKVHLALTARVKEYRRLRDHVGASAPSGEVQGTASKAGVELVAIAASTGGPPALQGILGSFERVYPFAIVVAQHMPQGFTKAFADRLNRSSTFEVREAQDGDLVQPGVALIAPGGSNLFLEKTEGQVRTRVVPPDQAYRYNPSADALFSSCAPLYGSRMLAVVLTGMGSDGSHGVRLVKQHGGQVLAESEESAVVYGMPREAAATGCVDRIVPLTEMPVAILDLVGMKTHCC